MKKFHILIASLLFIITASVTIQFSLADEKYVGIEEEDEYIWRIYIDEELADEFLEDTEVFDNPSTSDDIYEENDEIYTSKEIDEGLYQWLNYSDDDWYKIFVEQGNKLKVKLYDYIYDWWLYLGSELELYVYNKYGGLISYSNRTPWEPNGWYDSVSIECSYTGYYYIQITNETLNVPDGWAFYFMEVDIIHSPPPPFDVRDIIEDFAEDYYDCEGIKMKIRNIKDENYHKIFDRWVRGDSVICKYFKTEDFDDPNDWEEDDDLEKFVIVNSDETFYHRYLGLIIADDVDWGDIADDMEIDFEQTKLLYPKHADAFASDIKSVSASERDNGLEIKLKFLNDDMDDVELYLDYDENGVLEYGELDYGDLTVMIIDLEKELLEELLEQLFENGIFWLILVFIINAAVIATGVIVGRKIMKKRDITNLNNLPEIE